MKFPFLLIALVMLGFVSHATASDSICSVYKDGEVLLDKQKAKYDDLQVVEGVLAFQIKGCSGSECRIFIETELNDFEYAYKKGPSSNRYGVDGVSIVCKDSDFVALEKGIQDLGESLKEAVDKL